MHGDLEALYDAHAHRLYAHCWSLLGDNGAADALRDTFTESVRHTPRGELVLWLHHMARTVCSERGAFGRHGHAVFAGAAADPLLNAAGGLPAHHREALLLAAGEWLDVRDIARVLGVSPGTVRERLHEARTGLERLVLDALMRGAADPAEHMDVIAAFEQGRLPHLLARRAPGLAPAPLRDHVLSADDEPAAHDVIGNEPATPGRPLVVIGSDADDPGRDRNRHRTLKAVGGVAGVAATIAVGLLMTWPSADEGTVGALGAPNGNTRPAPPAGTQAPGATPPKTAAPDPKPTTEKQAPAREEPPSTGGGNATGLQKPPERETPPAPPSATPPPDSRRNTPPPSSAPPQQEQPPNDGGGHDGPLKPVTDIVDHLTSPILSGLAGG